MCTNCLLLALSFCTLARIDNWFRKSFLWSPQLSFDSLIIFTDTNFILLLRNVPYEQSIFVAVTNTHLIYLSLQRKGETEH